MNDELHLNIKNTCVYAQADILGEIMANFSQISDGRGFKEIWLFLFSDTGELVLLYIKQ